MEISEFLIDEEYTLLEAMMQLDKVGKKVLFVTKNGIFIAALTDGDIRRWILSKGSLDAKVKEFANYNPISLHENEKLQATELLKNTSIEVVPIIDNQMNIVSLVFWNDKPLERKGDLKIPVVMMAGGQGTRLYPYTKILPKPLIPIGELPISEHIINRFHDYGTEQFYLVVNYKKNMIKAYFNEIEKNYLINFIDEEIPLGTGGGLSLLKGKIKTTFFLTNCDIIIDEDYQKIYEHHKKEQNLITMVCSVKNIKIPYGVIEVNENGEIDSMREKPVLSFLTNTGMYVVEPKVIEALSENEEIGFPTVMENFKASGEKIGIYPISENNWLDMGQFDELEEMRARLNLNG